MPTSLYSLFTSQRRQAVFKELEQLFSVLTRENHHTQRVSTDLSLCSSRRVFLEHHVKSRQSGRKHIEIPLKHISSLSASPVLRRQLPSTTLQLFDQLYETAFHYLEGVLKRVVSISSVYPHVADRRLWDWPSPQVREALERRSVLRLLEYPEGVGCRPHYDPGLCSALLLGSADGLEIAQPRTPHHGSKLLLSPPHEMSSNIMGDASQATTVSLPVLPVPPDHNAFQWVAAHSLQADSDKQPADVIVMSNYHLERITNGYWTAVWHRVRPTWNCSAEMESRYRHNVVVELRLSPLVE